MNAAHLTTGPPALWAAEISRLAYGLLSRLAKPSYIPHASQPLGDCESNSRSP